MNAPPNGYVTMLDDLPELEDLERYGGSNVQPPGIRMDRSNMVNSLTPDQYSKYIRNAHMPPPASGMTQSHSPPPMKIDPRKLDRPITCLDTVDHVQNCPICCKFYSNDRTVYIIVIVVLALVCILLLKKVLNV